MEQRAGRGRAEGKAWVSALAVGALLCGALGCAVGQHHSYRKVDPTLPVSGNVAIAVATHDQRQYIMNGDKQPSFVGLQRSGAGIPYAVTTESGRPLAEDFTEVIHDALEKAGYRPESVLVDDRTSQQECIQRLAATGAERLVLVTLRDWKSDTYNNTGLHYDLRLDVYDGSGGQLATTELRGKDDLGGSVWNPLGHAKRAVPEAFSRKLEQLFSAPRIREAL
jgi:hypothetical protein